MPRMELFTTVLPHVHAVAQYIKQETLEDSPSGKQATATRLITERASRRIGEMAFKLAAERPRKARLFPFSPHVLFLPTQRLIALDDHSQIQCSLHHGWSLPRDNTRCGEPVP